MKGWFKKGNEKGLLNLACLKLKAAEWVAKLGHWIKV